MENNHFNYFARKGLTNRRNPKEKNIEISAEASYREMRRDIARSATPRRYKAVTGA